MGIHLQRNTGHPSSFFCFFYISVYFHTKRNKYKQKKYRIYIRKIQIIVKKKSQKGKRKKKYAKMVNTEYHTLRIHRKKLYRSYVNVNLFLCC